MKVRIIIQCRTNSSRLPGKAFLPLKGFASVLLCAKRAMNRAADVIIATSTSPIDNNLVQYLKDQHISVVRGPLEDVLKRYVLASADLNDSDLIVRLTADNTFPDGVFVNEMVDHVLSNELEYCSTDFEQNRLPYGLAAEVFTVRAIREADKNAISGYEREHVTPWLRDKYKKESYLFKFDLKISHLSCTIDTLEDYLSLQRLFENIENPIEISWRDLCSILKASQQNPASNIEANTIVKNLYSSEFILGTAQIGLPYGITNLKGLMSDDESSMLIQGAIDKGINAFDCARGYGIAEQRLGEKLTNNTSATIITKLDPFIEENCDSRLYPYYVRASVYQSCKELRRSSLDILMLHRFWQLQHSAILDELLALKDKGVIKALGISVYSLEEACTALKDINIEYIQIPFNILEWRFRNADFQKLVSQRQNVTFFARSIFLQGLLIAPLTMWPDKFHDIGIKLINDLNQAVISLKRKNIQDLCISYVRSQPWIRGLILGCLDKKQLDDNLLYFMEPKLSPQECEQVHKLFPQLPETFLNPSLW